MSEILKFEIRLPQIPDIELVAIGGLRKMGQHLGIGENKICETTRFVTESICNAFKQCSEDQKEIKVIITMTEEKIVILIDDYEKVFDRDLIEEPGT